VSGCIPTLPAEIFRCGWSHHQHELLSLDEIVHALSTSKFSQNLQHLLCIFLVCELHTLRAFVALVIFCWRNKPLEGSKHGLR
jgi:hypothetical protein